MLRLKEFCETRGISYTDVVAAMREQYPKFDKPLCSKAANPEQHGVRLVEDAERLLEETFATTAPKAYRRDRRRLPKIQCRLPQAVYEALQRSLRKRGYDTVQAGLQQIIAEWLEKE